MKQESKLFIFIFLLFLGFGLIIGGKVSKKIEREEKQNQAILDLKETNIKIDYLIKQNVNKPDYDYVNTHDNAVKDSIIIQTYQPTADCIQVSGQDNKIILNCIKR